MGTWYQRKDRWSWSANPTTKRQKRRWIGVAEFEAAEVTGDGEGPAEAELSWREGGGRAVGEGVGAAAEDEEGFQEPGPLVCPSYGCHNCWRGSSSSPGTTERMLPLMLRRGGWE